MKDPIQIGSTDPRYGDWLALRQRILRDPLGLRYAGEDVAAEADDRHLLQFGEEGNLLGGLAVRIDPAEPRRWKIRQVAVDEPWQRRGIGRRLMKFAMDAARVEGAGEIVLHSRAAVIAFYEALGFRVVGEAFEEVGIPHRKMTIDLGE